MTGKLLGAGAIRGEDGARYYYDEGEIKNLKDGQKLESCEVDFDTKDGKAIAIYITSDLKAKANNDKNDDSTQQNDNPLQQALSNVGNIANNLGAFAGAIHSLSALQKANTAISLINQIKNKPNEKPNNTTKSIKSTHNLNNTNKNAGEQAYRKIFNVNNINDFIFKGVVNNCRKEVLHNIKGNMRVGTNMFGVVSGGGNISTTHLYSTYFNINNKIFVWKGNNLIDNGDEIVVYAEPTLSGHYKVECLKNFTKGLMFEKNIFGTIFGYILGIFFFGIAGLLCLNAIIEKRNEWAIVLLLFTLYTTIGYRYIKRFQFTGIKSNLLSGFLFFLMPIFFPIIIETLLGYSIKGMFYLPFVGGAIFCIMALMGLTSIKRFANKNKTKAINDAVREYE